jgi:hypothetical protein
MPSRNYRHQIGKYLSRLFVTLFFAGLLFLFFLTANFIAEPTAPAPLTGHVIPWSNHGTFHYITPEQYRLLNWTFVFCACMFVCGAVSVYLERTQKKPHE